LAIGEPCEWDPGCCGSGNYCHWTSNTCQPASKLGESCSNASCAENLTCATTIRCVEPPLASESVCKGTPSVP
jgi:hypothetical protein